jgi:hypothetical protein
MHRETIDGTFSHHRRQMVGQLVQQYERRLVLDSSQRLSSEREIVLGEQACLDKVH